MLHATLNKKLQNNKEKQAKRKVKTQQKHGVQKGTCTNHLCQYQQVFL